MKVSLLEQKKPNGSNWGGLTWAIPVTVILTPWLVYTAGEVTVRVIVFRDSLQHRGGQHHDRQQGDSFCGGVSQVCRLECSSFDINVHRCQNWRTLELTRLGCKYDTRARDEDLRYPGDWYGHAVAGVNVDGAHRDGHRVQRQSAVHRREDWGGGGSR